MKQREEQVKAQLSSARLSLQITGPFGQVMSLKLLTWGEEGRGESVRRQRRGIYLPAACFARRDGVEKEQARRGVCALPERERVRARRSKRVQPGVGED